LIDFSNVVEIFRLGLHITIYSQLPLKSRAERCRPKHENNLRHCPSSASPKPG